MGRLRFELVPKDAAQDLIRTVRMKLEEWVSSLATLEGQRHRPIPSAVFTTQTVKATVRRNGEWYNFSYGHHLSSAPAADGC